MSSSYHPDNALSTKHVTVIAGTIANLTLAIVLHFWQHGNSVFKFKYHKRDFDDLLFYYMIPV